jgi:hypothetical protein
MKNYPKTAEEVLSRIDPQRKEITEKLRSLVKSRLPKAEETVKRGVITYVLNGKSMVQIRHFKNHVDLGFFMGARLSSPTLKGRGNRDSWRHVEVKNVKKVDDPEITRLLGEALRLTQV